MVYDLVCEDVRLTIEVTARDGVDGQREWHVEAHTRSPSERRTLDEQGRTASDAVRAVGRSWVAQQGVNGFPLLDWEAVTQALIAVRAI